MKPARRRFARLRSGVLLGLLAFVAAACSNVGPQDALHPEGPVARQADQLFKPVFWIAVVVFFLVEGALVLAAVKFRRRSETDMPVQVHGNKRLEIIWTIIPALLLAGISVPTVITIFDVDRPAEGNALNVEVMARQWWWEYRYTDLDPVVVTANELHIPVGREVNLQLKSADVIHSFWVPKLAGKQDVVPGRVNHLKLLAEKPDTYFGQCAEFCALSHANMRLRVVAQAPADFDAWVAGQQTGPVTDQGGLAAQGAQIFKEFQSNAGACIFCHAIEGVSAGVAGPNLTHIASRKTFGGATYDLNAQNLTAWLRNPEEMKPGSLMPRLPLSDEQIRALVAYLLTLE